MKHSGPPPKRSSERRRRNKASKPETVAVVGTVGVPDCPANAHPIARDWFESLKVSGQSQYYEPSDWAQALALVEMFSRLFKPRPVVTKDGDVIYIEPPLSGPEMAAVSSGMADMMTNEPARRRVRIEVERKAAAPEPESAGVAKLRLLKAQA